MKTTMRILIALAVLFCANSDASASLVINIGGNEFSGSGANAIANDAIVLTFESLETNVVRVTVVFNGGTGVAATAKLNDLVFNVDPLLSITGFSHMSGVKAETSYGADTKDVDGSKGYDVLFNYPPPGKTGNFVVGLSSVYHVSGTGLVESSFDFTNSNPNSYGPFHAAVHINAVNNGNSGHYGNTEGGVIPEPSSFLVWALGLLGCSFYFGRRRFRA